MDPKSQSPIRAAWVRSSSEHETISVDEMIKEFEIELLDDYFARALAYRHKPGNMEK